MPYHPEKEISTSEVLQLKEKHCDRLLAIEGVEGVGVGFDETGTEAIRIYLRDAAAKASLPQDIEGTPIIIEITGEIGAL